MTRWLAGLVLCASSLACIQEPCRPGTVYIDIEFVDSYEAVDGVALRYQLDDGPLLDVQPSVPRPAGTDRGSLELRVKDYAKHTNLLLQFAPTKQGAVVGEWRSKTGELTSHECALADIKVQILRSDGGSSPDLGLGDGADVGDARAENGRDLAPDALPDTMPDALPETPPDEQPTGGEDAEPDAQPDQAPDILLRPQPDAPVERPPSLDVAIDGGRTPIDATRSDIRLPGLEATLTVGPTTGLNFGSIPVGSQSVVQSVSISNIGQAPSGALAPTYLGPDYLVLTDSASDCGLGGVILDPGSFCTVRVVFRPITSGDRSASLGYSAGTPATTVTVPLLGMGFLSATLTVIPATYTFPDTPVGSSSTQTFSVINSVASASETGPITLSIGGSTDFVVLGNTCVGASLAPGATCSVVVGFKPIGMVRDSAYLNVISAAGVTNAAMDGVGVSQIEIVPSPLPVPPDTGLDFGQVPLGQASNIKLYDVWVRGEGQTTLSVSLQEPNVPASFIKAADTCSTDPVKMPNPTGPVCQIGIQFIPQGPRGALSASLSVSGSAGGSDVKSLTGTATCLTTCAGKCGGPDGCGSVCPDLCVLPQVCGGAGTTDVCGEPPTCTTAPGTATWSQIPVTSPWPEPGARYPMAHDLARDRFVLFSSAGETWEWDPGTVQWLDRTPSLSPSLRYGHTLVYDPDRGTVLMFGGWGSGGVNDTWEWNGAAGTWTQRAPTIVPPATERHGMAYDPVRGRMVMVPGPNVAVPTTWEWDGSNWTERYSASGPPPYGAHDLVWDSARQRTLLVNHAGDVGIWQWNPTDATWLRLSFGCVPSPRGEPAVAYAQAQDRLVLFGGGYNPGTMMYYQDLWQWAPGSSGWQSYPQSGAWPSGRLGAKLVYDVLRGRLLLFGGAGDVGAFAELWELHF